MTEAVDGGSVAAWQDRARRAEDLMGAFEKFARSATDDADAVRWAEGLNTQSHVGSRHHYVPRFLLERWAEADLVQVYSRVDGRFGTRNIRDLAMKDFYTFINTDGEKDSSMESLLGQVERPVAALLRDLLNPFVEPRPMSAVDLSNLAMFASFQLVRTPRHRREAELQAEWLVKTTAEGKVPDAALRTLNVTPHQNQAIAAMGEQAQKFFPLLACRPVALLVLDRPRLLIGDDPLLVNVGPDDGTHVADCFMTDAEFAAKADRERSKKKGRRRKIVSRIVHFSTTVPRGLGVALEVVLPISPRAALLWGPLGDAPYLGGLVRERLDEAESQRFADLANAAMCTQALDWVVSTRSDTSFAERVFPPVGPLMRVCGGENAAALSINETPERLRPARLWAE